jgi:hypothetical protein
MLMELGGEGRGESTSAMGCRDTMLVTAVGKRSAKDGCGDGGGGGGNDWQCMGGL